MTSARCLFAIELPIPSGHECREHRHGCTEIVYNDGCAGVLIQGGTEMEYAAGSVFVYQPSDAHRIRNRVEGRQVCVGISGCGAETLAAGVFEAGTEVVDAVRRIEDAMAAAGPLRGPRLDLLAGLLVIALERETAAEAEGAPPGHAASAKEILDTRFDEPISVRDVAAAIFISPDYLRQVFREAFGESPLHYLIQRRIEHACELLRASEMPVHEVARLSGIDNPYYFSRLFRKSVGLSPSEYRQREQKASE